MGLKPSERRALQEQKRLEAEREALEKAKAEEASRAAEQSFYGNDDILHPEPFQNPNVQKSAFNKRFCASTVFF